ncbi:MAG TPA: transposase [Gaiellaceae bacterium]|nr:transposase [Gaiellaceae bacterium]
MRRDPVALAPETVNHVTYHATGSDVFAIDDHDRDAIVAFLGKTVQRYQLDLHDYCVMTNHIHLVVRAPHGNLPRAMQHFLSGVVLRFNRRHGRRGHLVQEPYAPKPILSEEHYLSTRAYVAMNPVEANLVSHPRDYRWCGFGGGGVLTPRPDATIRALVEAQLELRKMRLATLG